MKMFLGVLSVALVSILHAADPHMGPTVDQGDYYVLADGTTIKLWRSAREVSVKYKQQISADKALQQARSIGANPALTLVASLPRNKSRIDILQTPDANKTRSALAGSADIDFALPVFINPQTGKRLIPTGEIVVGLNKNVTLNQIRSSLESIGLKLMESSILSEINTYKFRVNEPAKVSVILVALNAKSISGVRYATPNFIQEWNLNDIPNDPHFLKQQALYNTGQNGAVASADVKATAAWDITKGDSSIVIAIIDTGVDFNQTDLKDSSNPNPVDLKVFTNSGEMGGNKAINGLDDDNNGKPDDWRGWNFLYENNFPQDDEGHGTSCAGIAAATGNNAYGICGIARDCKILPIKVSDAFGFADDGLLAAAIMYAAKSASVISCSWGGGEENQQIKDAIAYATQHGRDGKGCPVFFASGNAASRWNYGGGRARVPVLRRILTPNNTIVSYASGSVRIGFAYAKDGNDSGLAGDNVVKIDHVQIIDNNGYSTAALSLGTNGRQDFEGTFLPSGWLNATTAGAPTWTTDTTAPFLGLGGTKSARSGAISHNAITELRTPVLNLTSGQTLAFDYNVSTEIKIDPNGNVTGDFLIINYYDSAGTYLGRSADYLWFGPHNSNPGEFQSTTTAVAFPASDINSISVGASTDRNYRATYSEYGANLDFVAPSNGGVNDIFSLDILGESPRSLDDINPGFGGTSAACPLAAGVGALMLSVNPLLTAEQVRTLMHRSCDKIGGVSYTGGDSGAGGKHDEYGYGKINAYKAVVLAKASITAGLLASQQHALVWKADGTSVWGWGANNLGQLGNGATSVNVLSPLGLSLSNFISISSSRSHNVALKFDGNNFSVWAWGENVYSQVRNSPTTNQLTPYNVVFSGNPTAVAAGSSHSLAIVDGYVWAWGGSNVDILGTGAAFNPKIPERVKVNATTYLTGATAISAADYHSLAIVTGTIGGVSYDRQVFAWGSNSKGQLGDGGTTTISRYAKPVPGMSGVNAISAGMGGLSMAIKDGQIYTWGYNASGQCASGDYINRLTPQPVVVNPAFAITKPVAISAGAGFAIGVADVTRDGVKYKRALLVWGTDSYGASTYPSLGSPTKNVLPARLNNIPTYLTNVIGIAAGNGWGLARTSNGTVYSWGNNVFGQQAIGSEDSNNHPWVTPIATAMPW